MHACARCFSLLCVFDVVVIVVVVMVVVVVAVPSRIEPGRTNDYQVTKGETIRLPCVARGDPQPEITWSKNGYRIEGRPVVPVVGAEEMV